MRDVDRTERVEGADAAAELAAEAVARLGAGETLDLGEWAGRLEGGAARAEFLELVEQARLADRALPEAPLSRDLAGRYRLGEEIGSGGMGRVFAAEDTQLGRRVAVKLLAPLDVGDPEREGLLLKESRILAALQHPGIVAVHDAARDQGLTYVVMDLVDGVNLAEVLERVRERCVDDDGDDGRGEGAEVRAPRDAELLREAIDRPVPRGRADLIETRSWSRSAATIVLEIARTIEAAHGAGVVHRDLKPGNVMLMGGGNPVVLDFGLSGNREHAAGGVTQRLFGSPAYLAPEQVAQQRVGADPRTDVYQLGLLLYELLTLQRAFPGEALADVLQRVRLGAFRPPRRVNPAIPRDLEAVCLKALELAPQRRYADAGELRADLERFVDGYETPLAVRSNLPRALARRARVGARRHPAVLGLAGMALVAGAAWMLQPVPPPVVEVTRHRPGKEPVVLGRQTTVAPGDALWIHLETPRPAVVYTLSKFGADRGRPHVRPVRPRAIQVEGESEELGMVGQWGVEVGAGERYLACSEVSDEGFEGLEVYLPEDVDPVVLDAWFSELAEVPGVEDFGVALEDAYAMLAELAAGTAARGKSLAGLSKDDRLLTMRRAEAAAARDERIVEPTLTSMWRVVPP